MTWQDELRRLDEELAAGRLSADDYRQRRDQLLAAANSNPSTGGQPVVQAPQQAPWQQGPQQQAPQQQAPPQQAPQQQTPQQQGPPQQPQQWPAPSSAQPGNPFPPPFRWETTAPAPEATRFVQPVTGQQPASQPNSGPANSGPMNIGPASSGQQNSGQPNAGRVNNPSTGQQPALGQQGGSGPPPEATQVVRNLGPTGAEPTQYVAGPKFNADSTQVVRTPSGSFPQVNPHQQPVPGQQQWPQQQGWASQPPSQQYGGNSSAGLPWGTREGAGSEPGWVRQGPEVFDDDGGANTARIIAIVVGVVVVLGIAAGAFFLWPSGSSTQAGGTGTHPATPSQPPKPVGPIAAGMPGTTQNEPTNSVKSFADLAGVKIPLIAKEEQTSYETAGAGETSLLFNDDNGNGILIIAVKADTPASARQASTELDQQQLKFGLAERPVSIAGIHLTGLDDAKDTPATPILRRAHYSAKNEIIRVEVRGKDLAMVDGLMTEILQKETALLTPDAS